ncbi:MAG: GTPase HflX, partial [Verrucomicrobia bacterium]|nr:GTPase HflX [Verrucomicrobiota bacterium]
MDRQEFNAEQQIDRVFLVGVLPRSMQEWEVQDSLDELAHLTKTAGAEVFGRTVCKQSVPHPGYFIGRGKAEEISE